MKKFLMFLIGIGLVLSLAGYVAADSVVAEDTTTSYSTPGDIRTQVTVSYDLRDEKYSVTIPSSFDFITYGSLAGTEVFSSVTARHVILETDHMLVISVKSTHDWNLTEHDHTTGRPPQNAKKVSYSMFYPTLITSQYEGTLDNPTVMATGSDYVEIFYVPTGVDSLTAKLKFTLNEAPDSLGTYQDALTFNIQLKPSV